MHTPTPAQLLDLVDAGTGLPPLRRALLLARAAWPEAGDPAAWSLGQLNARLLMLRAALFGQTLHCLADCPNCAAVADASMAINDLLAQQPAIAPTAAHAGQSDDRVALWRLPTPTDLLALEDHATADLGSVLLERVAESPAWTPALRARVEQEMAACDPLAHIELVLDCPACGAQWSEPLAVADLLWTELATLAQRLVDEVVALARAFGWGEADVLAMTPQRRQRYLARIVA